MGSYFELVLDTSPPANPDLLLQGGAGTTGTRIIQVDLSTADYQGGASDVAQMKLWGDVDPVADALVQPLEADSAWQTFSRLYAVTLSAGDGRKVLRARLRDDVRNETLEFNDFIDYSSVIPVVDITTGVDRSRISKKAGFDQAIFSWQASEGFTEYQVRVVPSIASPHQAGVPIATAGGSVNTSGAGSFPALTPIATTIRGADLEAASPGDTAKIVKVFVKDTSGLWSP